MSDNLLDDIMRAYAAAKIQREHILNQNGANLVYNHGRDIANKLGVGNPPQGEANAQLGITPFPSPVSSNNVQLTDSSAKNKQSPWATAALLATAALGGAGLATAVPAYLSKNNPAETKPAEKIDVPQPVDSTFGAVDIDVR